MKTKPKKKKQPMSSAIKAEIAMIEAILEGSPDGVGVAVVRLACGCRKMAAVARDGEPASKVIMYRDAAESICDLCKADSGAMERIQESFIHWKRPEPTEAEKMEITRKALGS